MKYKIIVDKQSRTNPSSEKREYEIDIEELRCKGDVCDTLVITKGEDYVMRRLELTKYFVLKELEEPIKQVIPNINIELFEGDNYIYIIDMEGNKFYAGYLIKNEFNDVYATKAEMSSAINQSAREVVISVNEKLTEYATTDDLNGSVTELTGQIETKAGEIGIEVAKKVDGKDFTAAKILLLINQDGSTAVIRADKISLEGKTLNLGDNMAIVSNLFNVDKNGKVRVTDATGHTDAFAIVGNLLKNSLYSGGFSIYNNSTGCGITADVSESPDDALLAIEDSSGKATRIGGRGITTPVLTQTSERKQKKNISKLKNALDIIKNVDIYKYNLKKEKKGTKKHIRICYWRRLQLF